MRPIAACPCRYCAAGSRPFTLLGEIARTGLACLALAVG
jgi:hypothetical protein